ncbi:LLM class flavin-dependent oxidoreductase [Mycobacterium sp.]|jgi:alkanesulfonate monooxygenase SsuD/methylene tetrahydromethanopterin reductase-like flavin-dependent oxidoreductase (luciferase family)|uniref:LLM class flavin-dependent oxidoreductase n=1 Tax=Mycobacterium sp. TaxID=1785 RepID=UPI002D6646EC|nr:LLM class flavin-dependent oxidoreductase [Mycobacterium sp.]HZA09549.1 LLM class flavin-dependent oxidoreductase [Mycobacterium sp.]
MTVPLSVLDLAPISAGSDAATALRNTIDLAQHAEMWGYKRYWIAEHHFVAVASSSPAVLIGQIAAATSRIRVGAAAVQLGHTTALAAVESFGMLDAFYPGRIDLGLGRSGKRRSEAAKARREKPPPPPWREVDGLVIPTPFDLSAWVHYERLRAEQSVLQQPQAVSPDFADQVADIEALLDGTFRVDGHHVCAVPGRGAALTPWLFGSSKGQSARVAGARGLPFVASYHITPGTALDAVAAYREAFTPSAHLREPYVVVSADVVVADDSTTARHLASTYGQWVYSIRSGQGAIPYPDPDHSAPLTDEQSELVKDRTATQFVGDPDEVAERMETLCRVTDADELVITSVTHRHADRLRSHELIAKRWGLTG